MTTQKRTERSRNLILDAAGRLIREQGIAATTMEQIARHAGLTRKTVYNLFSSKEEIALRLVAQAETNDAGYRQRMAAGESARDLLDRVFLDSAGWCMANPSLARLALSPADRPSLEPPVNRPSFQGLVRDVVILGQQQGLFRKNEDPGFLALVLLAVYGQAMLNALNLGHVDEVAIRAIVRIVIEGIGAQTPDRL